VAALVPGLAQAAEIEPTNTYILEFEGGIPGNLAEIVAAAGGVLHRVHDEIGIASALSDDPDFASFLAADPEISQVTRDILVEWIPNDESLLDEVIVVPQGHDPVPGPEAAVCRELGPRTS
jgi:hypothetical protein